jgi:hypothetical protein
MTRNRAALAIPAVLVVLSGCGVAAVTARTKTVSVAIPKATEYAPSVPPDAVIPAVAPTPTPPAHITPVPPSSTYVVGTAAATGGNEWLEILSHTGALVARTEINPTNPWMTAAGAGGAYWTQGGAEYELSPSGAVHRLGAVPDDANAVLIGPDGRSYAYATTDQTQTGVITNRIVVARPGAAPVTIADRVSNPASPQPADAPQGWNYYLISWNASGIVFARVPTGGCGCGSFDMQMQSQYSAFINPTTQVVTELTSDGSCPLSAVGPGMATACFTLGSSSTTGLRMSSGGVVRHQFTMSGANAAGDAVFSPAGTALAYITIPNAENSCGVTWNATLHVLNLASGSVASRTLGAEFSPAVWAANGLIYGSMSNGTTSWLVAINPATFSVTRLTATSGSDQFVGIV